MIKNFLGFHKYPTNTLVFILAFSIITIGTLTSFFYAWAQDEGTLGTDSFNQFIANSFYVFRFPAHNILYLLVEDVPFLGFLYFPMLFANILLQTMIVERFITLLFIRKSKRLRHGQTRKKVA